MTKLRQLPRRPTVCVPAAASKGMLAIVMSSFCAAVSMDKSLAQQANHGCRDVGDDDLDWVQHGHRARGGLVELVANARLEGMRLQLRQRHGHPELRMSVDLNQQITTQTREQYSLMALAGKPRRLSAARVNRRGSSQSETTFSGQVMQRMLVRLPHRR